MMEENKVNLKQLLLELVLNDIPHMKADIGMLKRVLFYIVIPLLVGLILIFLGAQTI